jgi:hypothetical protein
MVDAINFARRNRLPIFICTANDRYSVTADADLLEMLRHEVLVAGKSYYLPLVIGMLLTYKANDYTNLGIANGVTGTIRKIVWPAGTTFRHLGSNNTSADAAEIPTDIFFCDRQPEYIFLELANNTEARRISGLLPGFADNVVPISPQQGRATEVTLPRPWNGIKKITISRTQFAATPATVKTAHTCIDHTLDQILVDLNVAKPARKDTSLIIYVLLSRVGSIDNLLILRPFDRDHLTKAFPNAILNELDRLDQLDRLTAVSTATVPGSIIPCNKDLIEMFEKMFAIASKMNNRHSGAS